MQVKIVQKTAGQRVTVAVVRVNKPRKGGVTLGEFKTDEQAHRYIAAKRHMLVGIA